MKTTPRLLNDKDAGLLPLELFSDLQLDKILSAQTISVLQKPCGEGEIPRRQELFELLEKNGNLERMERLLSVLSTAERSLRLLNDAKIPLDRYHRYAEALIPMSIPARSLPQRSIWEVFLPTLRNIFLPTRKSLSLPD